MLDHMVQLLMVQFISHLQLQIRLKVVVHCPPHRKLIHLLHKRYELGLVMKHSG